MREPQNSAEHPRRHIEAHTCMPGHTAQQVPVASLPAATVVFTIVALFAVEWLPLPCSAWASPSIEAHSGLVHEDPKADPPARHNGGNGLNGHGRSSLIRAVVVPHTGNLIVDRAGESRMNVKNARFHSIENGTPTPVPDKKEEPDVKEIVEEKEEGGNPVVGLAVLALPCCIIGGCVFWCYKQQSTEKDEEAIVSSPPPMVKGKGKSKDKGKDKGKSMEKGAAKGVEGKGKDSGKGKESPDKGIGKGRESVLMDTDHNVEHIEEDSMESADKGIGKGRESVLMDTDQHVGNIEKRTSKAVESSDKGAGKGDKGTSKGAESPDKGKGKGKAKTKKGSKSEAMAPVDIEVHETTMEAIPEEEVKICPDLELKAAIRIQAMFRGWKARRLVKDKKEESGPRSWQPHQRICLLIECVNGTNMPSVNTFGGCDPFVEFRLVQGGNPLKKDKGSVHTEAKPGEFVKTEVKQGDTTPSWNEKFELTNVPILKDAYLQIILWDYNLTGNTPIGQDAMQIETLIEDLQFEVKNKTPPKNAFTIKFRNLLDETLANNAQVNCRFGYLETTQYNFNIKKASRLPKVDMMGTIDGFIEARIVKGNPRKVQFESTPPDSCLWSAKTGVIENQQDPKWDTDFEVILPAYSNCYLQLILWDRNTLMDTTVAQAIVDLDVLVAKRPKDEPIEQKLKFQQLVGVSPAGDFSKSRLYIKIQCKQLFETDISEDQ